MVGLTVKATTVMWEVAVMTLFRIPEEVTQGHMAVDQAQIMIIQYHRQVIAAVVVAEETPMQAEPLTQPVAVAAVVMAAAAAVAAAVAALSLPCSSRIPASECRLRIRWKIFNK